MNKTNVLVIGSGGREHGIAWKLKQSPQAEDVYVAPGNPGTEMMGCKSIPISPTRENFDILIELIKTLHIGLVVVGPDNPLELGITDWLMPYVPVFGPKRQAARIEYSKSYALQIMEKAGIPHPVSASFPNSNVNDAINYARERNGNVVVKANGLAFGKGVRVCHSIEQAVEAINDLMVQKVLGKAGESIVIQERLEGKELSIHALCDGEHVKMLPPVRDYKHLLDGNKGPMTGGMGAYGPIDVEPGLMETIKKTMVIPCVHALAQRGSPFIGCLYLGIMLTPDGPKVLEFNARFGDPEAQVLMRLLDDEVDLIEVLLACTQGRLNEVELKWKNKQCICVVATAFGYPENPGKGDPITFRDNRSRSSSDSIIFHSGTAWKDGRIVTNGGRVFSWTSLIDRQSDIPDFYDVHVRGLSGDGQYPRFGGMHYRTDIGS